MTSPHIHPNPNVIILINHNIEYIYILYNISTNLTAYYYYTSIHLYSTIILCTKLNMSFLCFTHFYPMLYLLTISPFLHLQHYCQASKQPLSCLIIIKIILINDWTREAQTINISCRFATQDIISISILSIIILKYLKQSSSFYTCTYDIHLHTYVHTNWHHSKLLFLWPLHFTYMHFIYRTAIHVSSLSHTFVSFLRYMFT